VPIFSLRISQKNYLITHVVYTLIKTYFLDFVFIIDYCEQFIFILLA